MTCEEQLANLKTMNLSAMISKFKFIGIIVIVVALALGFIFKEMGWYLVSIFSLFFILVSSQSTPYVRHATQAAKEGKSVAGSIEVEIIPPWSDNETYMATTVDPSGARWKFQFIPIGWKPVAGKHNADLIYIPGVEWPALVKTPIGILFPRYQPQKPA